VNKLWIFPLLFLFFLPKIVSASTTGASTNELYLFSMIFLVSVVLLIIGYEMKSWILHVFAGFIFTCTGLWIIFNADTGLPGYSNIISQTASFSGGNAWLYFSAWILIGFGLFYFLMITFLNTWGKRRESEW